MSVVKNTHLETLDRIFSKKIFCKIYNFTYPRAVMETRTMETLMCTLESICQDYRQPRDHQTLPT